LAAVVNDVDDIIDFMSPFIISTMLNNSLCTKIENCPFPFFAYYGID